MIKIAGKEFRTLAQPIYVNGRHVRQVWANGEMVYPETLHGNTIKIRGHILEGRSYFRPERYLSRYDPWMSGEIAKVNAYTETFSVSASFAAVLRYSQDVGLREDGITLIPVCGKSFESEWIPTEGHWQYSLPCDMFTMWWQYEELYLHRSRRLYQLWNICRGVPSGFNHQHKRFPKLRKAEIHIFPDLFVHWL